MRIDKLRNFFAVLFLVKKIDKCLSFYYNFVSTFKYLLREGKKKMLKFFVENSPELDDIASILALCGSSVRRKGFAENNEIAFFYNEEGRGFRFAAHKFKEKEVPDCVCETPFLVEVGREWKLEGLSNVIKNYRIFFNSKMPVLYNINNKSNKEVTNEEILSACKGCVRLPWGGFPKTKEGEKSLVEWLKRANEAFFPPYIKDSKEDR